MSAAPIRVGDPDADPRAWAHRLRRRELMHERLTNAQRAMWRAALREGAVLPDNGLEGNLDERKAETQRRVQGYTQR